MSCLGPNILAGKLYAGSYGGECETETVYIRTFSVFLFNKVMAASTEAVYSAEHRKDECTR